VNVYQVLLRPIVTEKSMSQASDLNQYTFEVAMKANKQQITDAVEQLFSVSVLDVRTVITKGKVRRWGRTPYKTATHKKAIVTLKAGDSITFFEGSSA
jgi:large subunit ribosomal protein L23